MFFKRSQSGDEITVKIYESDADFIVPQKLACGKASIIGTRESQQDSLHCYKNADGSFAFGIVCDGIGGQRGGHIASTLAQERFSDAAMKLAGAPDSVEYPAFLEAFARQIDMEVSQLPDESGRPLQAGTTLSAVVIVQNQLFWLSVGDSRIYLLRNQQLQTLTRAHNYAFLVEQQKGPSFQRNPAMRDDALVSFIGKGGLSYLDVNRVPLTLQPDDLVILCSDGLYKALDEKIIRKIILANRFDLNYAAARLTAQSAATAKHGLDNTSVVLLNYIGEPPKRQAPPKHSAFLP